MVLGKQEVLAELLTKELKPYVKKIDQDAFYAENFLRRLGEAGLLSSGDRSQSEVVSDGLYLVRETAEICMTTAFCLWCHLAALTYVRTTENERLKADLLPSLEDGSLLGATGLSNPMKHYAGLENLHLKAKRTPGGYLVSGVLPAVSNLGRDHVFGAIAGLNDQQQIMMVISCDSPGLTFKEKTDYLGLNGSATFSCSLREVFIAEDRILSEEADAFVANIRPTFIAYQIPLGLGVTDASVRSIEKTANRQNGCNQYLPVQAPELQRKRTELEYQLLSLISKESVDWKEVARIRLSAAYLTLESVQADMLHNGSSAYQRASAPARRLREAYFFANLTPTIKHLEKVLI
ncbi:acyl-CoA dehydrogenase family protein [Sporosarcina cascadiensis]|uniref:acyl-CoA dehydrogenase family protein n=1 Tax=Sporosarcina cascadiensis TaxID=2660747 RepID=UPI00129B79E2|nr:acyl-CoA dehydrogenase family protein [Sporosarcina cascadiensis]